jgi:hypothetical protein
MKSKIILLLLTFALVTNIYAELKNNKTTLKVELTNVLQINFVDHQWLTLSKNFHLKQPD